MSAAGRREQVGDAGIRLVARDGIRALTHLRVDAEADLPRGSTSYYARTRHDLLRLVVNRLSERSRDDAQIDVPAGMTRIEAADFLTRLVGGGGGAPQPIDLTARTALVVELRDDAELRDALTVDAPWRKRLATVCEQALASCAVAQAHKRVSDLVSLIDAMLMYRACRVAQLSTRTTLRAYFAGLG